MLKLIYDQQKAKDSKYDERGLTLSANIPGKKYPSKMMFIKLLQELNKNEFRDLKGTANIWSENAWQDNEITIHVELKYCGRDLPKITKQIRKRHAKMLETVQVGIDMDENKARIRKK